MVGLGNADNTSDINKPISTATQTALDLKANTTDVTSSLALKANINNPTFTGTVGGITKSMVGLNNVDNTSDINKPVSTATQTVLDFKANSSDVTIGLALKAPIDNPTFTGTVAGIDKTMVGLSNADNTSDANKPISTATQTALDLKENTTNKSTTTTLGTSDVLYPTQNAVKAYVDATVSVATPDASASTKGKIQLAGDLGGTAALPMVPGLALKANASNVAASLALKANLASPTFTGTVGGIDKSMVGLGNVDNTSDLNKPISTATQTALNLKANINNPTFTGTVNGVTKTMVGLGSVDNTSDASKPISNAAQTALNFKEDQINKSTTTTLGTSDILYPTQKAVKTYVDATLSAATPDASASTKGKLQLAGDLGGTAALPTVPGLALKANASDVTTSLALKANLASPTFTGTVGGIDKTMVGLGNVDNTTDLLKPISTATQTALNLKANLASPTFTGTVGGIDKTMVGLGNVDNTSDANKPVSSATQTALNLKENTTNKSTITTLGTSDVLYPTQNAVKTYVDATVSAATPDASASTKGKLQLAGDLGGTAALPTVPGLALKANASDVTTSLALKANLASPTFTGTVGGIDKTMVGLGNVDNTSDANKPVSSATQTALNLKENTANKSITTTLGTSDVLYPTQNAVKTYVDAQVASAAISLGAIGSSNANGASLTSGVLRLSPADATNGGILTNGTQTIAGDKSFAKSINAPIISSTPQVLSAGGTVNWDPTSGLNASVTLNQNSTLNFANLPPIGSSGTLVITQPASGSAFSLTLPNATTNKVLGSSNGIALSTTNSAKDILSFYYDGNAFYWNIGNGYGSAQTVNATNIIGGTAGAVLYQSAAGTTGFTSSGTSGQVLTSAGNGAPTWTTPATGVGGSGTSNYVSKFSATSTLANSSIMDDGTSVYFKTADANSTSGSGGATVKIGTNGRLMPASSGTTQNSVGLRLASNNNDVLDFGIGARIAWLQSSDLLNLGAGYDINLNPVGGNVGIGMSTAPTSKLDVNGNVKASSFNSTIVNSVGSNVIVGQGNVLASLTTGSNNVGVGQYTLNYLAAGSENLGMGYSAMYNTRGSNNVGLGHNSLWTNNTGNNNTAIGHTSGYSNTGSDNTFLGYNANSSGGISNATAIGSGATVSASNTIQLGNTSTTSVNTSGGLTANAAVTSEITSSFTIDANNAETYKGKIIICNPSSAITITFAASLPTGFNCMVLQKSADANKITFAAGSSVTIKNRNNYTATAGNYAIATIVHIGSNIIVTAGDMQ